MLADLYDFDKTVFLGESGSEFYLFCLKKNPKIIKYLPVQIWYAFRYFVLKNVPMSVMKEKIYSCLNGIDGEKMVKLFWEKNESRMCPWFKPREHDVATVVCSASPLFQIKPICDKLGVNLIIATRIDIHTGKIDGENCKREEKVRRIKSEAFSYTIRDVYTDNLESDAPMLSLATRNKYKVSKGAITKIN
jgi:phosphatidylglycerophosphatase C